MSKNSAASKSSSIKKQDEYVDTPMKVEAKAEAESKAETEAKAETKAPSNLKQIGEQNLLTQSADDSGTVDTTTAFLTAISTNNEDKIVEKPVVEQLPITSKNAEIKVEKPISEYKNLNSKNYTDTIVTAEHLELDDENCTYEMHYMCRALPKLRGKEFKSYYCKPVGALFKKVDKGKILSSEKIYYETIKDNKLTSLVIPEKKFKAQPTKPFWIVVVVKEKEYNGNVYYYTTVSARVTAAVEKIVQEAEEKYHLMREEVTETNDCELADW
jgi:hypothetical protein